MGNPSKKGEVWNPEAVLIILRREQTEKRQSDPDQPDIDVKDKGFVARPVWGIKVQYVNVEKSSESAGKNVLFGFMDHIEGCLQKQQKKHKIHISDKSKKMTIQILFSIFCDFHLLATSLRLSFVILLKLGT